MIANGRQIPDRLHGCVWAIAESEADSSPFTKPEAPACLSGLPGQACKQWMERKWLMWKRGSVVKRDLRRALGVSGYAVFDGWGHQGYRGDVWGWRHRNRNTIRV